MSDLNSFESLKRIAHVRGYDLSLEQMDQIYKLYLNQIKIHLYTPTPAIMEDCIEAYFSESDTVGRQESFFLPQRSNTH